MNSKPRRIIMRACVTDIPGDPSARSHRLGCDACSQILGRPLSVKAQTEGFDYVHVLPNFDSKNDVKAWFLYDFNFTGPLDKNQILAIPHEVCHATRQKDSW
jgi:hypothetical protein